MAPGLFVLSQDSDFVARLRGRFSPRYQLVVAESLDVVQGPVARSVQAALVHFSPETLDGRSPQSFLNELRKAVWFAPIYGLVDPRCPADVEKLAAGMTCHRLRFPVDFEHLERLLENPPLLPSELNESFAHLPHRVLRGKTQFAVTFTLPMFKTFDELKVAAAHDVALLLVGETGIGKTFLARLIHELSARANQQCLTVACGTLSPSWIERELFGCVKGAMADADLDQPGKLAAADDGTLFLNEIDVLAPQQQAKLLRVIETGAYEPVGTNDARTSNARLILASNTDLEPLVEAGTFRKDLYYRLNALSFHLPPLRRRTPDVEFLAREFASQHGRTHGIDLERIEPEFLCALKRYPWPGNIRELENVIRRAVLCCRQGIITLADLPDSMQPAGKGLPAGGSEKKNGDPNGNGSVITHGNNHEKDNVPSHGRASLTLEKRVDQVEHQIIAESLERHNFHRTATAKELGISRVTLYNKMKKFGMFN